MGWFVGIPTETPPASCPGIGLLRHQHASGCHLHWEQSILADVHHYTKAVDFDMCTAGHLQDPNTGLFIKRGWRWCPLLRRWWKAWRTRNARVTRWLKDLLRSAISAWIGPRFLSLTPGDLPGTWPRCFADKHFPKNDLLVLRIVLKVLPILWMNLHWSADA